MAEATSSLSSLNALSSQQSSIYNEPSTSSTQLSEDFDAFLLLLTTQMSNQDPLEPMESAEFTNQLVMFAQAEQSVKQSGLLEEMLDNSNILNTSNAVGYIGMEVKTEGNEFAMVENQSNESGLGVEILTYEIPQAAKSATMKIYDADGKLMRQAALDPSAGEVNITWDGQKDDGSYAEPGNYSFSVSALDANDNPIDGISYQTRGTVNNVLFNEGETVLTVDNRQVKLSDILAVGMPGYI